MRRCWPLLLLLCAAAARAQPPGPVLPVREGGVLDQFPTREGLSQNSVSDLIQDRRGFLWFATAEGLNRYDGSEFVVYRHDPTDPASLSSNRVVRLHEDRAGRLWVVASDGINRLDAATGTFRRYRLPTDGPSRLTEDAAGVLRYRVATALYRYDPARDAFVPDPLLERARAASAGGSIGPAYVDRRGDLWVDAAVPGGRPALLRLSGRNGRATRFEGPAGWTPGGMAEDSTGRLWLTLSPAGGGRALLAYVAPTAGRLVPFGLAPPGAADLLPDGRGGLWMSGGDGVYRFAPSARAFARLRFPPGATTLGGARVMVDRSGGVWAGAMGGLFYQARHAKPFGHLAHDPRRAGTLARSFVLSVAEAADGTLYAGSFGGELNRIDRRTGAVVRLPGPGTDQTIWALYRSRAGAFWLGAGGLYRRQPRTDRFVPVPLPSRGPVPPTITHLAEDARGVLFLAAYHDGVIRYDPATGAARRYGAGGAAVQTVFVDRRDRLWLGLDHAGVARLDPATGVVRRFSQGASGPGVLAGATPWAFFEDARGGLWIGSEAGLARYDPDTGAFRHFVERDGLPSSVIYAMLPEGTARLWLSTNRGLVRFDLDTGRFRAYGPGDGLRNTEFNRHAAVATRDGTFYFGGLDGLTFFRPEAVRDNPYPPPVALAAFTRARRDTARTVRPTGEERAFVLVPGDYTFSFRLAALSFTNPGQNRIRYRLEGFDRAWVEAGLSRTASYTNVPPGRYVFRAQAANDDGLWNPVPFAVPVVVQPPWWATRWFRGLVGLLVLAALAGLYRWRVRHLLATERLRLRIASDLHDDVGADLSSLALMSELAGRDEGLPEPARRRLAEVSQAARGAVETMSDVVWAVNPDRDRAADLLTRMRDVAATLLEGREIVFHVPDPAGLPSSLPMEFRRQFFLAYKEVLHNVAKHADARRVHVRLDVSRGRLVCRVADDGAGFDPAAVSGAGHGLKSLARRADALGGHVAVASTPGQGTTVTLSARIP